MRGIKFRGQRVDTKEWVYGSLIECGATGKKYIFPCGNDNESEKVGYDGCLMLVTFEVIEETVGQFTGLHDKNGVEIYEGDKLKDEDEGFFIVRFDEKTARFVNDLYGIKGCLMEYGFDEAVGDFDIIDTYDFDDFCSIDDFEVIGNIHNNPELLKESEVE